MKKILPILFLSATMTISAEINSPFAGGCLQRGIMLLRNDFTQGAIDQAAIAEKSTPSPRQASDAAWIKAIATLRDGNIDQARQLLIGYLEDYPATSSTLKARVALGDCDFYQAKYTAALDIYDGINPSSPDLSLADDLAYRKAYCHMMLGHTAKALAGFATLSSSPLYSNAAKFYQGYLHYSTGDYTEAKRLFDTVNHYSAPGDQTPYYLTQIAFKENNYDRALSMARQALRDYPDSTYAPEMLRIAGESLYHSGETAEATGYLDRYLASTTIDRAEPSALYILGINAYQQGDLDKAVRLLTPVTRQADAIGQSAYLYIGQASLQQGNMDAALMALEKAYKLDYDPSVRETAFYNYAVTRMEGGRTPFGSSVALMEDFLRTYPNSRFAPQVQQYLVTGYMTDNDYDRALASINAMANPSPAILAAKQRVLYILGSRDLAANHVDNALQRFRESKSLASAANKEMGAETDLWIGDCLYRLGKYPQAADAFNAYLRTAPKSSPNRTIALYDLAYTRFAQHRYNDALADFKKVTSTPAADAPEPRILADAYSRMADCYYYNSDFNTAAGFYDKALATYPSSGDYPLFQKAIMRGITGAHAEKIDILDSMMQRYPTSGLIASALLEKAESLLAVNRPDDALSVYSNLTARYPATSQGRNGYLQMAITQISLGRTSQAIDTYKKVISSYPTSDEARIASDDLKRILADEGNLDMYASFIATVPDAPRLDTDEIDHLTFQSAEKDYLTSGATHRLEKYVEQFPAGQSVPQALGYLATSAFEKGDHAKALDYATTLSDRFPHSEYSEEALAIKGDVELEQGDAEKALTTFRTLEASASGARNLQSARIGIMRVSRDLGRHADVIAAADALLSSSALSTDRRTEVLYSRAYALARQGDTKQAAAEWEKLAADTDDLYGAMSAFHLADRQFKEGKTKQARRTVNALIDSNTPHQYWIARGYILLSDISRSQGNTFEADEYLKSLRENYPGSEADIFQMIDSRLNK
ncbi:tetratricopeptide repeat protein [uncultured Muribaculum sp.]|uniref:tetratricopeptide repeat protein n=1 Tax=uncultured Muribaculum sp. TaxID=1918613 RepID=UPI0025DDE44B|nr:tetratricopeptide repeat protein [uncultured Muribaculum sp.]